ncbi:MAG TPA: hypothetical protein VIO36_03110 [Anaerolineaceae bacterium]
MGKAQFAADVVHLTIENMPHPRRHGFHAKGRDALQPDGSIARRTPWNCAEVFTRRTGCWQIIHTHWSFIGGMPPDQTAG